MCIPAPTGDALPHCPRTASRRTSIPTIDDFFADLGKAYAKAVKAFYDAGCRYLQFDDTVWSYLCSPAEMAAARERMPMADNLPQIYQDMINTALAAKPADMTITTHVCRGNFKSTWVAEGGYEPIAERLLGGVNFDGYFLEYDTDRAGGFEPLRFLPKGDKIVVLGLVTSKSGTLEKKDDLKRRIDEATKFAALDQFCLSPQCGFASTEEGNILAEDEQWAKFRMIVRDRGRGVGQGLMLFPTTLVGSYPQPDWLIDRASLAKQMPPRVRAQGAVARRSRAARRGAGRRHAARHPRPGARRPRHRHATASSAARAIPTASPPRSTASTSTIPARRRTAPAASPSCRA